MLYDGQVTGDDYTVIDSNLNTPPPPSLSVTIYESGIVEIAGYGYSGDRVLISTVSDSDAPGGRHLIVTVNDKVTDLKSYHVRGFRISTQDQADTITFNLPHQARYAKLRNTIYAGAGDDSIIGSPGADRIFCGNGNDTVSCGGGRDRIRADAGDDVINAGGGSDNVWAGKGNDRVAGQNGKDRLYGDAGEDSLSGGSHNDILDGGTENDVLTGGQGDDTLTGSTGDDSLYGNDGDDRLAGNKGRDHCFGGKGFDRLDGGDGPDELVGGDDYDQYVNWDPHDDTDAKSQRPRGGGSYGGFTGSGSVTGDDYTVIDSSLGGGPGTALG
jgi:Ca2+-binding RTX toxin-like protein